MTGVVSRLSAAVAKARFRTLEACNRRLSPVGSGPVWRSDTFPWLAEIAAGQEAILVEFDAWLEQGRRIPEIGETDPGSHEIYGRERWDMLHLYVVGHRNAPLCRQFPGTEALLQVLPGLCHASFSVLGSDRHHVPAHRDGYNGVLRMHLPLRIPPGDCFIRVGTERIDWRVGDPFVFDPGIVHEVRKDAAEPRLILIADFFRPGPAWLQRWSRAFYTTLGDRPEVRAVRERYRQLFGDIASRGNGDICRDV